MSLLASRRGTVQRRSGLVVPLGYADEVLADNPVAYWRLEETSGATVADEVSTNDLAVLGANLNVSGAPGTGSAASFDGTDDYLGRAAVQDDALDIRGPLSLECWINGEVGDFYLISKNHTGGFADQQYGLVHFGDNMIFVVGGDGSNTSGYSTSLLADVTYHVVATWDGTRGRIYVDGALATDRSLSPSFVHKPNFSVGRRNDSFYYQGMMDEVAIYDYALSGARILAHYNAGVA